MQIITIQLTNQRALKLLQDMEELNLIKLLPSEPSSQSVADKYFGKLDNIVAEEAQEYIKKSREEWDKNI
ncbi:hypothetical protein BH09BAC1_BH09BAC1_19990 [soil metagenome]